VCLSGLALFTAVSPGRVLADSLRALTFWRAVQGLGSAGIMGVNAALVRRGAQFGGGALDRVSAGVDADGYKLLLSGCG
jgi:hypothetical protein